MKVAKTMNSHGGARKGAGRKKGVGLSFEIQRYCERFIFELLKDEAIKRKALKQVSDNIKEKDEWVYIIKSNNKCKIGYSSSWSNRLKSYRTHLPNFEIVFCYKSPHAFELEADLHRIFLDKRESGEWFSLTDKEIIQAVSYCCNIEHSK